MSRYGPSCQLTSIHYPPVHQFTFYKKRFPVVLPRTEDISRREITLPLHPLLTERDVDHICGTLSNIILKHAP
ncbi:MAG: DegT/DnrJ/EryC1/StrS family aminotransferase [Nanoarchaeota archaeon]|nr:DegT/DnrJ/EryC1/StrS family aminotransferase [Nanoarchaeota archaeon]